MRPLRRLRNLKRNLKRELISPPTASPSGRPSEQPLKLTHDTETTNLKAFRVSPQLTDPRINDWLSAHHIVSPPLSQQRQQLLLFLSGSFGNPKNQTLLLWAAAQAGYHAINLSYPNSWKVGGICRRSSLSDCHQLVRLSILDGVKRSNNFNVSPENSLYNRLNQLLMYLKQQHPGENWEQYITDNQAINWANIAIAGHSQGGGHAALIAKQHAVARCIMLGAPADFSAKQKSLAPWLSEPHATPAEHYYGFTHAQDKSIQRILSAWKCLGLSKFGPPVNVDQATDSRYQASHQLITNAQPSRPGKYHGCVAVDANTPLRPDGTPAFAPVWQYLLA
ncbi:MAG: hypothetical protein AB8B99_11270 [Phormidesmis sp.]